MVGALHRRLLAGLMGLALASALLPAPAAGAVSFTFTISLGYQAVIGSGPPSALHTITLFAPSGEIRAVALVTSDASGYWYAGLDEPVFGGDKVRASALGASRTVTVPGLWMRANRVTDVISGKWMANTVLKVLVTHRPALDYSATYHDRTTTAGPTGTFSIDFTGTVDLKGADTYGAVYMSGPDAFWVSQWIPYMVVRRANTSVEGIVNPAQVVTLTLKDSLGNVRGSATAQGDYLGFFYGDFATGVGEPVLPRKTDRVVGSFGSDANVTVPDIRLSGVAATDVVTGACMAGVPFELFARKADYGDYVYRYGTTDSGGNLTRDLTADVNLAKGDVLRLTCRYTTGDRVVYVAYVTT